MDYCNLFLLIFAIFFFEQLSAAARVPICNGLRYTGSLVSADTGKSIYSYGFDFGVSVNPNNSTYPNQLRITNFEDWSSDPKAYYQAAPLMFSFNGVMNQCPTMNETCFIDYPNGICEMYLPLMINGSVGNLHSNSRPIINNGHIFDGYYGGLMQPDANDLSWNDPYGPIKYQQAVKCTNFYYINVPEDNYGNCMDFKSKTIVSDPARNTTVTLNADHLVTSTSFNVTITNFTSSPNGFSYIYGPNIHYYQGTGGDTKNPIQTFQVAFTSPNYQIEWAMDLGLTGSYGYGRIIAGELIKRNGIFYKYDSIPYTVSDPCFKLSYVTPYYNNATAETEFCCTLFATK